MQTQEKILIIPFGADHIALTQAEFDQARLRACEYMASVAPKRAAEDSILDAEGISELTGIPATWFQEQARRDRIPHIQAGKYVRFSKNDVLEALKNGSCKRDTRI